MSKTRKLTLSLSLTLIAILLAAVAIGVFQHLPKQAKAAAPSPAPALHMQGAQLVSAAGVPVQLHGVNRSGGEFGCVQSGANMWNGPMDQASISAMLTWHINAVRVPLNEDCWLGINGANPGGSAYISNVQSYVNLAISNGLYVILDLHWTAPGSTLATGQQPMPDSDHSPAFWTGVANTFKNNPNVFFDLFNEPYPDNNQDTAAAWSCWKNGGNCPSVSYPVAGMQTLVNTVRATGATNLLLLGGVEYSNALSQWLANEPTDPDNNLAADWHSYNFNNCNNSTCWNTTIAGLMQHVPVITDELGESDCAHGYIDSLLSFLDSHNASYLAWTWNNWDCSSGPSLISDYTGTPTNYGIGYKNHLAGLSGNPTPTPTATSRPGTPTRGPATPTPTPPATPTPSSGGNGVTATGKVSSNSPWFGEEDVTVGNTANITALTVMITVAQTTGVSYNGMYNTIGGQIAMTHTTTGTNIMYTFTLSSGQTLSPGSSWLFAAQFGGTGSTHSTSGDSWTVTATSNGSTVTINGHF